jgi:DNA-binding CsgD family transcriptional regulator
MAHATRIFRDPYLSDLAMTMDLVTRAFDGNGRRYWVPALDLVETDGEYFVLDEDGSLVSHAGCSNARLAPEGWPVRSRDLHIRTLMGRRPASLATIALRGCERPVFVHVMREKAASPAGAREKGGAAPWLTPRQRQVLALLAEGVPAKMIATRLALAEPTVRNHIRAILRTLGCRSQLEALATARRFGLG